MVLPLWLFNGWKRVLKTIAAEGKIFVVESELDGWMGGVYYFTFLASLDYRLLKAGAQGDHINRPNFG